ncbi:MAG: hypothetical protein ACK6DO_09215, partial [Planctomycetia bacterium]
MSNAEGPIFQAFSHPRKALLLGISKIRGADRLQAGLVNVIYPTYQAAESFGRCKRKVSSTDRSSGAFENNLLESFLPVSFFPEVCVIRKVLSCLLPAVAVVAMCTSTWA